MILIVVQEMLGVKEMFQNNFKKFPVRPRLPACGLRINQLFSSVLSCVQAICPRI